MTTSWWPSTPPIGSRTTWTPATASGGSPRWRSPDGDLVTRDARIQDVNATLAGLFPYLSPFDNVYRVRFDRTKRSALEGRRFELVFASAIGKMELIFGDGAVGPDRSESDSPE